GTRGALRVPQPPPPHGPPAKNPPARRWGNIVGGRSSENVFAAHKHHTPPPHRSTRSICDLFNASIHCRSIITIAKPLRQHVRQPLRLDIGGGLQATWPNFAAYCPRAFGMHRSRPHPINWPAPPPSRTETLARSARR